MTTESTRAAFLAELTRVAPDLDPGAVRDSDHLQDDLELDSMDFLNLVAAIHTRLGVSIPEADYPRIATVGAAVSYLETALGASA